MKKFSAGILVYILLVLAFTVVLGGLQEVLSLNYSVVMLPQLAPGLAFLLLSVIFREINFNLNIKTDPWVIYKMVLAFILPFLILFKIYLIGNMLDMPMIMHKGRLAELWPVLPGMILGAVGEEIGWRGFLQPRFEKKFPVVVSGIFTGIFWGLWHVQLYTNGVAFMLSFLLFTISSSVVVTWMLRGTSYNSIVASLFHLSLNLGFFFFFYGSLNHTGVMLTNGIVWTIPALIIGFSANKQTFYNDVIKAESR
ncbi:CPBP family intramembrane glutamic endopeptidase [Saccharicrinis sp. FJH54]|uniref:CPBP family intramembrane glutamic endopeptidase n=1 Tax=Saccharicrinis sp. FJH54 TaxID=3344665 RepID=UPI0035D3FB0E